MEKEEKEGLTFWDHLEELRWTLLRTIIAMLIFTIGAFFCMPYFFDHIVLAPCNSNFYLYEWMCEINNILPILPEFCDDNFHVEIININLASQFFTHMSTSFWLAFIFTCPYLVFEIWRFISPALYKAEKSSVRKAFLAGTLMFFLGCFIGYILVFPLTLRFLAEYQLSETIQNQINLNSYMDNFLTLIFMMGLVFELPLVSWLLSKLGIIKRSFFKKYRRYAVVILLVLSAIITPSGDPFTLAVVFLPLYLLYEVSSFFVKPDEPIAIEE